MKIKTPNISNMKLNIGWILTLALFLILFYEVFLGYKYIYSNISVDVAEIVPSNIVRVNLETYQDTIEYLDSQKNFTAQSLNLPRPNPFRP